MVATLNPISKFRFGDKGWSELSILTFCGQWLWMRLLFCKLTRSYNIMAEKGMLVNPSADRNKEPIKKTLGLYLQQPENDADNQQRLFLEIASGTGQHIVYLASHFPHLTYMPSEVDKRLFYSIWSYIDHYKVENVKPPAFLDVRDPPDKWLDGTIEENSIDFVLNVNMMHISEWKCTEGLFNGCGKILKPGQFLFTYGPYAFGGTIQPESNVSFNKHLQNENPDWGLRDVKFHLEPLAASNGIHLLQTHSLPANNHLLIWQKKQ